MIDPQASDYPFLEQAEQEFVCRGKHLGPFHAQ